MKRTASRDLLATLRANPDDAELALVYADALTTKGDPRGELIVLQHRAETDPELQADARAHLEAHADDLLGPLADADVTWHRGFVRRLEVGDATAASVQEMLDHPSAQLVTDLALDPVQSSDAVEIVALPHDFVRIEILLDDFLESATVIDALAERHRPKLQALRFGSTTLEEREREGSLYMAWDANPLVKIDSIRALAKATPKLTDLELRGEYLFGGLEHPNLRRLTLFGDSINGLPWAYLEGEVLLPRLERLEMTLLMDEYRPPMATTLTLDAARTPKLRELLIHNPSHHYNDGTDSTLLGFVRDSEILPQLRALTLAEVRHDDDLDTRAFQHLERFHIDVLVCADDDQFEARFRKAFPMATFGELQ